MANPLAPSAPVTLDFSTAQPISQSPANPSQSSGGNGGVSLDFSTAKPITQQTAQPQLSQPYVPTDQISAIPDDTFADKAKNWANNVTSDLRHGTNLTGIGTVLKKMGAHGLDMGVSPGVADFMGSLPLGLLRAVKGSAELTQSGQRWQGTKDTVGGLVDASQMPSAFISPEVGEVAGAGIDTAGEGVATAAKAVGRGASSAAKAVKGAVGDASSAAYKAITNEIAPLLDPHEVQAPLQAGIRKVLSDVADEAGVTVKDSTSIRDVAGQVADAVEAKAKTAYKALDDATGGQFQRFQKSLKNINQKLRETTGLDDDAEKALLEQKAKVEQAQQSAFTQAKASGVDPATVDSANADWKKAQALRELDRQLKMSANGIRPELAGADSSSEVLDPNKVFTRLNRLNDRGRLAEAVGPDNSAELIRHADNSKVQSLKIADRNAAIEAENARVKAVRSKIIGTAIGTAVGGGAIGLGAKTLFGNQ